MKSRCGDELFLELQRRVLKSNQKPSIVFFYSDDQSVVGISGRQELPPLGLLYLAASLEKSGISVKVIPFDVENINLEVISHVIQNADIIGYSITATSMYSNFIVLNNILRKLCSRKELLFIAGSTHSSLFPEQVLLDLDLDGVFPGEGEISLLMCIAKFCKGMRGEDLFNNIPGIFYKSDMDSVKRNSGSIHRVFNLDIVPFPSRHLLPEDYIVLHSRLKGLREKEAKKTRVVTFITSRGCPFACAFCANLNNGSIRYRGRRNIEGEVLYIQQMYDSIDGLLIMDEIATLSSKHVKNWTNALKGKRLKYIVSTRGDSLDIEKIEDLADSGCWEIKFGLETGSQSLLDRMNKRLDLDKVAKTLELVRKYGVRTKVFLLHGFPGENQETTEATIRFLEQNRLNIDRAVVYRFTPVPGSPVFTNPTEYKLILDDKSFEDFTIYQNRNHWWGTPSQYIEVREGYQKLQSFVERNFER